MFFNNTTLVNCAKAIGRQTWVPVRVRHAPYNFLDGFRQRALTNTGRGDHPNRLHFVAFTCNNHFWMLRCALESLLLVASHRVSRIQIFIDDEDFISDADAAWLKSLSPAISATRWPRFTGWGFESVRLQFKTFSEVAASIGDDDYIVKIDSDLLFLSDWIFDVAPRSGADVIGDGRYIDFAYAQGGCFFLGKRLASRLADYCAPGVIEAMFRPGRRVAEEDVLREVILREGSRVWLTRFMMFPDEFEPPLRRRPDSFVANVRNRFSVLHFIKHKDTMLRVYRDVVRPAIHDPHETTAGVSR